MVFKAGSGFEEGPGSRERVVEDVPFIGRTSGKWVFVTIIVVCIIVVGGFALSWNLESELPVILSLVIGLIFGFGILALPAYLGMWHERLIVRNGTKTTARIVGCERVGRAGPNMCFAIARVQMKVELACGDHTEASVRRIVYSLDYRDTAKLIGRELWVYWHESFPNIAVPESQL
jgi:hypothetical protein